ncbi:LysR family transcriptional regulator [Balneatrix alpica]|uniref:LysR family transcriptional regulator n=1 Tax=Balneatrix alpica TaxID=75684 RepID=A0ABV5Z721_9GAMM|nr:LysR family transcriptional regulator [Balneatrix alpica]
MIHPSWLKTFTTLVETEHFTQTAEKLFMTQPGVSQHIRKLEQACGYPLLLRTKKHFELTEQGRLVYQYAKQQAQNEHHLLNSLGFDDPFSGLCRLGCSGALALRLYPGLLQLQTQHPKLITEVEVAPNQRILHLLNTGELDLGIVTAHADYAELSAETLGQEHLCLVLPHRYANRPLSIEALHQLGLIRHPDVEHYLTLYCSHSQSATLQQLNPRTLPSSGYINQLSQILLPVAQGLGFTVLPLSAVKSFHAPQQLYILPTVHPVYEPLYLVKRRYRSLPTRFDTLIQCLREILA